MSDQQTLKEIAETLDFEGWSMDSDEISEVAKEIRRYREECRYREAKNKGLSEEIQWLKDEQEQSDAD